MCIRDRCPGGSRQRIATAALGPFGTYEPYRIGNVVGTANVVDAASRAGARLVHVSSTAVYPGDFRYRHAPTHEAIPVSYTHLRAHETGRNLVCRLLLEKKK